MSERQINGWNVVRGQLEERAGVITLTAEYGRGDWVNFTATGSAGHRAEYGYHRTEKRWSYNRPLPAALRPLASELLRELKAEAAVATAERIVSEPLRENPPLTYRSGGLQWENE